MQVATFDCEMCKQTDLFQICFVPSYHDDLMKPSYSLQRDLFFSLESLIDCAEQNRPGWDYIQDFMQLCV